MLFFSAFVALERKLAFKQQDSYLLSSIQLQDRGKVFLKKKGIVSVLSLFLLIDCLIPCRSYTTVTVLNFLLLLHLYFKNTY